MSADSFHARVESELRKLRNVYDFEDFVKAINRNCLNIHGDKPLKKLHIVSTTYLVSGYIKKLNSSITSYNVSTFLSKISSLLHLPKCWHGNTKV